MSQEAQFLNGLYGIGQSLIPLLVVCAWLQPVGAAANMPILTDRDILAAAAQSEGKDKTILNTNVLGIHRGMKVIVYYLTAGDVAYPGWQYREIAYDMPPGAACERAGGVTDLRTRIGITTQEVQVCVPAMLARYVPVRNLPRYAFPTKSPSSWIFNDDDIPPAALRAGMQGIVGYKLSIGINGRVVSCEIVKSSGFKELDEATCRLVQRRGKFLPAIDSAGRAVVGSYSHEHTWLMPKQ